MSDFKRHTEKTLIRQLLHIEDPDQAALTSLGLLCKSVKRRLHYEVKDLGSKLLEIFNSSHTRAFVFRP